MIKVVDPSKLSTNEKKNMKDRFRKELEKIRNYTPKVGVFGDTGVGKSSLCNALFGSKIAKTSHTVGCTREAQEILVGSDDEGGMKLVDVPGVGENPDRHQEYLEMYETLVKELDLVLWAIKSIDRNNMASIDAFEKIIAPSELPVVFVLTQADLMSPHREWDTEKNEPSKMQKANLNEKVIEISRIFKIPTNRIVVVSANDNYNLSVLVSTIVEALPNEKKFAFTREAKDENVTDATKLLAEKGIVDHLIEKAGVVADFVKEEIIDVVVDSAKKYVPTIVKSIFKFIF